MQILDLERLQEFWWSAHFLGHKMNWIHKFEKRSGQICKLWLFGRQNALSAMSWHKFNKVYVRVFKPKLLWSFHMTNTASAPLYFQAWASADSIPPEVSPSLLCPQCRFADPHGKCACHIFWCNCCTVKIICNIMLLIPGLALGIFQVLSPQPSKVEKFEIG